MAKFKLARCLSLVPPRALALLLRKYLPRFPCSRRVRSKSPSLILTQTVLNFLAFRVYFHPLASPSSPSLFLDPVANVTTLAPRRPPHVVSHSRRHLHFCRTDSTMRFPSPLHPERRRDHPNTMHASFCDHVSSLTAPFVSTGVLPSIPPGPPCLLAVAFRARCVPCPLCSVHVAFRAYCVPCLLCSVPAALRARCVPFASRSFSFTLLTTLPTC